MFSGMTSKKPEPNPYSETCNIENEVAKELARDIHISFMMTSTEIDACKTKKDIERMVDVYIDGIKTVMISRIFMKHPRFLGGENGE